MTALTFPDLAYDASVPAPGPIRFGSEAHKVLFCRTLLDTFDPYKPAVIDWPKLDPQTQARITALPIWDIAVQTENRAGLNSLHLCRRHFRSAAEESRRTQRLRRTAASPRTLQPRRSPMASSSRPNLSMNARAIRSGRSW